MLISSKNLLLTARLEGFAVPHFNFWNDMSARGHVASAESKKVPIILAWAQKHESDLNINEALNLGKFYGASAKVPIVLHLDHGFSPDIVKYGIDNGFTSVMIDASEESFEKNIVITKDIVEYGHQRGVVVEAEIGHVGTSLDEEDTSQYTEVEAAIEFVKRTNVDSLAISIGTSHGVYKSKTTPHLNFERLSELRKVVPVPLVLHGGSSSGDVNLRKAANLGISKVNVYTDLANAALQVSTGKSYRSILELLEEEESSIQKLDEHYIEVFETHKLYESEEQTFVGAL
ncbi:class II fructose-bisphosphate aldolase [Lacticaseibacillus paracasei]|uniref:Class II fructose-bisphosphate aldolase n=1 Tax=Lacticaseibacillus paracasei TaxID=1597 RepID=A0ABD5D1A2_LACPA|nr:class II fructose-bisphosphate aldolase [Lacticaseibacillus paracasei]EPC96481.1 fructose/tagatose bisphosphate aldolase [Lacticaseibacillus paracasei subsp. paracasei CNCM I-4649]MDR7625472.1 class II fructose-bisphosphate aldolase [Lacticaseibacillus paracasei]QPC12929.1 class II fructose-bisphosphate aldolase [Lacticaseibacillus paracasei subsp. tolerans]QUS98215.1 class II fructose-bisphosphate aldolase [Lacticaseibacillus paracasei subsp. tolerans]WMX60021.1 class II fructose-bisphosph